MMAPQLRGREATAEDVEAICSLACELAGVVGESRPGLEVVSARLSELLEEPRARILVAEG